MSDSPQFFRRRSDGEASRRNVRPRRASADSLDHLRPVSGRPPLSEYLRLLLDRRHFVTMHAWSQSTTQHRGTLLGNIWLILGPTLDGLFFFVIFGIIMRAGGGMANFFAYLVIGIFMFSYTTRSLNSAAGSINSNRGLIRAFTFPRMAIPLAAVLRETFATLPVITSLIVLLLLVPPGVDPTWHWLLVPVVFLLHFGFNLGLGLILARLAVIVPDTRQIISYIIRFWMYGSAVVFAVERFDRTPPAGEIVRANPMFQSLHLYRGLFMEGDLPAFSEWLPWIGWSLGLLIVGTIFFWRGEVSYGRE